MSERKTGKIAAKTRYEEQAYLIPPSENKQKAKEQTERKSGKGVSDKIIYKPYEQNQPYLIPPSTNELIPQNHLVRLVSGINNR